MTTIIRSWKRPYHPIFRPFHIENRVAHRNNFAPLNIIENDNVYKIELSVPGWDKKDIEIKVEDDTLSIRGEKADSVTDENEQFHVREFAQSRFYRSVILSDAVDQNNISAELKNGILSIEVSKMENAEEEMVKKIEIQ